MKLDSPEARAFVKLMTDYDPQVALDLHTTNGSRHGYYLTYAPPLNPATDPVDHRPAAQGLAAIGHQDDQVQVQTGTTTTTATSRGATPSVPGARSTTGRASTTATSACAIASRILSEAYAYATFEDRIKATSRFVEEVLNYAKATPRTIKKLTADADRRIRRRIEARRCARRWRSPRTPSRS